MPRPRRLSPATTVLVVALAALLVIAALGPVAGARGGAAARTAPPVPPQAFYASQHLSPGYGYLKTRDGTTLAVNVVLPGPPDAGPYPTVVEYSGYDPANPDSQQPASRLAQSLGYATVGVNLRGTGCSGGTWDYFPPVQAWDGYDAIEAVAAQPWVLHSKVGMVGISYPGITQPFVAATRPPHLAAIAPLSVIADTYRGVEYPGGILNTGFAVPWARERQSDAEAAPAGGQGWAKRRIAAGDATCRANQARHHDAPDVLAEIGRDRYDVPAAQDHLSPELFVHRIDVPTFLAGAWQDEQTGGQWPAMIDDFARGVPLKVTLTNGTHADALGPDIITRWAEFLDFYVARKIPSIPADVRANAAEGYARLDGIPVELPPDRFTQYTDFGTALAEYEAEPPIRVLFDNGAGAQPGAPVAGFEQSFSRWPVPGARATSLYLGPRGSLTDARPTARTAGRDGYRYDPNAMPTTNHPSSDDDLFSATPAYDWKPLPDGTGLAYVTQPLTENTVVLGPASADLWLRSSAADTDLEVVITEVRPDGNETYVQSGWLRASRRRLDPARSSLLAPVPSYTRADAQPLPKGRFVELRVPIFPMGHAVRAGSRIRVIVQAPGGNRPLWAFDALSAPKSTRNEVSRTPARASRVILPIARDVAVPTALPACPALRGQPCRTYVRPEESP